MRVVSLSRIRIRTRTALGLLLNPSGVMDAKIVYVADKFSRHR